MVLDKVLMPRGISKLHMLIIGLMAVLFESALTILRTDVSSRTTIKLISVAALLYGTRLMLASSCAWANYLPSICSPGVRLRSAMRVVPVMDTATVYRCLWRHGVISS